MLFRSGHYCVFHKLRAFKDQLEDENDKKRVDVLYDYWQDHDVKAIYCQDVLNDTTTGRFIDCKYPYMATARLSGMMLDYNKLMKYGVNGLIDLLKKQNPNDFILASIEALDLFKTVIDYQVTLVNVQLKKEISEQRRKDLTLMKEDLIFIRENKPETFHQEVARCR